MSNYIYVIETIYEEPGWIERTTPGPYRNLQELHLTCEGMCRRHESDAVKVSVFKEDDAKFIFFYPDKE